MSEWCLIHYMHISFNADKDVLLNSVMALPEEAAYTFTRLATKPMNRNATHSVFVTDQMKQLYQWIKVKNEQHVCLQGPPGSGKTTTLFWLYSQFVDSPLFAVYPVPFREIKEVIETVKGKIMTDAAAAKTPILFVDLIEPNNVSVGLYLNDLFSLITYTGAKRRDYKVVMAMSSLFSVNTTINPANFSSLIKFTNEARVMNIEAFKSDVATQYLNNMATSNDGQFQVTRLYLALHLGRAKAHVQKYKDEQFNAVIHCMNQYGNAISWYNEIKILVATIHSLSLTSVQLKEESAKKLMLVKSYLIYVDEIEQSGQKMLCAQSCFDLTESDMENFVNLLWSFSKNYMRTDNNSVVGEYFETCMPRHVFKNNLSFTVQRLNTSEDSPKTLTLKLPTIGVPFIEDKPIIEEVLYHTSNEYASCDYLFKKKNPFMDRSETDSIYLVAIEVSIQTSNRSQKITSKILSINPDITTGMTGVIWIMINPLWKDFAENFETAQTATSARSENARTRFSTFWYGQPENFEGFTGLHEYLQNIFLP